MIQRNDPSIQPRVAPEAPRALAQPLEMWRFPDPANAHCVIHGFQAGAPEIVAAPGIHPSGRPGQVYRFQDDMQPNGWGLNERITADGYVPYEVNAILAWGDLMSILPAGQAGTVVDAPQLQKSSGPTPPPPDHDDIPASDIIWTGNVSGQGTPNIGAFARTADLTALQILPPGQNDGHGGQGGIYAQFTKQDSWPLGTTPGWSGKLQFSLCLILKFAGQWYGSAPIEAWDAALAYGGPVQQRGQIPGNWFYNAAWWGPLAGKQPQPGEQVGFCVVSGDCRNNTFYGSPQVQERSNIKTFNMPPADQGLTILP